MIVKINNIDDIHGSVWLAASILAYNKYLNSGDEKLSYSDLAFRQHEIEELANKICSKKVHNPRISQWCNGDHPNNLYNYLRDVDKERRITIPGEFSKTKEMPENLLNPDEVIFESLSSNDKITYSKLLNWITTEYKNLESDNKKDMKSLEIEFFKDMKNIYLTAKKECGYNAARFLQMLGEMGGVQTAKRLISKDGGSDGFSKLWELNRLDLSIEALILSESYKDLFTEEEKNICRERLESYGYRID